MSSRTDRGIHELRRVEIIRGVMENAAGSVLIKTGRTHVLCAASWEPRVPKWREGSGSGWVTVEYDMLPASTVERRPRNRAGVDGRAQEIQRLIGRSIRAVVDMNVLGENSILLDCDVLQADGGTRVAGITGAFVALTDAVAKALREGWIGASPIREAVAAVSVGCLDGEILLDLDYREDAAAQVDLNLVMTESDRFVEAQGTGERATFTHDQLLEMIEVGRQGIRKLLALQRQALETPLHP